MSTFNRNMHQNSIGSKSRRVRSRSLIFILLAFVLFGVAALIFLPRFLSDPSAGSASSESSPAVNSVASASQESSSVSTAPVSFATVGLDYFDDALFVGDSRTVGLCEYSDLKNATYFADAGLSVFKLFSAKLPVENTGKTTLQNLLTTHTYGKIYLMLGINELGYPFDSLMEQYQQTVQTIQSLQPNAILYLNANLHVTKRKSDAESDINNANVDKLNAKIAAMADDRTSFYINVNELFDDASGNLDTQYTNDDAHVLAKYYRYWGEWLCTKAIKR